MTRILLLLLMTLGAQAAELVYFGTYGKGVYVSRFDDGKLEPARLAGEVERPSWVAMHPNGRFLYAASEQDADGAVAAFAIDRESGALKPLNRVASPGGPCHLAVDAAGKRIYVANYGAGTVAVFAVEPDGRLGGRVGFVQHKGSSVNPRRQTGPHAHEVVLSPDGRSLLVPDLGLDRILSYRADSLAPGDPPYASVKPGAGPRHMVFHPGGKFAYVINEMGSSVTAFAYRGGFREIGTVSTLPAGFQGESTCAEIAIDRSGRHLYASNRGDDSIAVFSIDPKRGTLTHVQRVSTEGKTPRHFAFNPSGRFLLAGNQNSGSVAVFRVDERAGTLTPSGERLEVPSPVCIQFLGRPR